MEKKIYMKPTTEWHDMEAEQALMAASGESEASLFDETADGDESLERMFFNNSFLEPFSFFN